MSVALLDPERLEGDKEYREELRHRCQTDGFFLAPFLGYHDFVRRIHQPVADLYINKSPGLSIAEQDPIWKNRMHLDPRHTFKTTWGFLDQVQWITCCPDVTIVNETATKPLGIAITKRVSRAFYQPKKKGPTYFQQLFPEFVVDKQYSTYRAPCSTQDNVEPTLYSTSVNSSQSGWHPWIINADDMVDTENSGVKASDESRESVWSTYQTNKNTLRTGGYINIRGTRYHPFDLYGRLLNVIDPDEWKMLIRSSMRVKSGERLIEGEFPAEDEVELLFPEMLSYKKLRSLFREDYTSYMCQQQNDPQGGGVTIFSPELYNQVQIESERVPSIGEVRICWRLVCEAKEYMSTYSEGVAVLYQGARVYVVDAWRGNFTPTELCERIVAGCRKWQCHELTIERTPGSDSTIPHIQNEAIQRNWSLKIDRPDFEVDDSTRIGRCKNLQPMMKAGRLWFSRGTGQQEEIKTQFTNFQLIERNGLIDCISRLALRIPASVLRGFVTSEQRAMYKLAQSQDMWDAIYGNGGAVEVEEAILAESQQRSHSNSYGLVPMLGGLDG